MAARVLVIGLDAAEASMIERWSEAGELPVFASLARSGQAIHLDDNPLESLPEAVWHELNTGIPGHQIGRYYVPQQVHTGEARARSVTASEIDPGQFFWAVAAKAGRRIAVIDPVHAVAVPDFNGVQLFEWGLHDRHFAVSGEPAEFLARVRRRYGDHPVKSCDDHRATPVGYRTLLDDLERGIALKTQLVSDLLREDSWDLLYATFAESHCVGHQFWHFQDPAHPRYDPQAPAAFQSAMKRIYRRLDDALGQLIGQAGENTVVMVVASHGMGTYVGGYQLLPEFLIRIGMAAGAAGGGEKSEFSNRQKALVRTLYHRLRGRFSLLAANRRPLAGSRFGRRVRAFFGTPIDGLQSGATQAVAVLNNRVGAIRLNLKGREPNGQVAPGNEAGAVLGLIREELMRLEDPRSGEPIVARVASAGEIFGPGHHPDVPDLMIVFRTDLGPLEACRSETVGLIERPLFKPDKPRTGDHTTQSRLWLSGPGIAAGRGRGSSRDLAPTVLRALAVPVPKAMAGKSFYPDISMLS